MKRNLKKFALAKKVGMTQYFSEEGVAYPATVLKIVAPAVVLRKKTSDGKDGYDAVCVGFGEKKKQRVNKPQLSEWGDKGVFEFVREFAVADYGAFEEGAKLDPFAMFEKGEKVTVAGTSKGKGFQGVVKRHGFAGGRRTHGQKHSEREPGSIGATGPQRVFKGTRMAGRMGGDRITVKGLRLLDIDSKENIMVVKGAVPGRRGTLIEIYA